MELYKIPLEKFENYDFEIELSGELFSISVRYNKRMERWIMDISDLSDNLICGGIPLVIGSDLLADYARDNLPKGEMYILNFKSQYENPTENTIEEDAYLYYVTV